MLTIKTGNIVGCGIHPQPVYIKHVHFVYGEKIYDIITVDGEFESYTYEQLNPTSVSIVNNTGVDFSKFMDEFLFVPDLED